MKRSTLALLATCVAVFGCAVHWDVDSYESPGANLGQRHTFFWKGGDFATAAMIKESLAASSEAQIREAISTELRRKGYTEVATAQGADMLVSYQVAGIKKFVVADATRIGAPSPNTVLSPSEVQPPPLSSVPREMEVRDGSVTVFLDDGASGKLLWRGQVAAQLRAGSAEAAARTVTQMTREIAKEIPGQAH